ncbi:alpha/beta-hydrolase [Atractiella rhizophila]|nr:alpha/beta-hydrolase [Atractiella rhizophila]
MSEYTRLLPELRAWYSRGWSNGWPTPLTEHPSSNMRAKGSNPPPIDANVALVRDVFIESTNGHKLRLLVVRPVGGGEKKTEALVSFHAGGGVSKSPEVNAGIYSFMAERGITVISVDYRLAPEHRLPASPEDADAAWEYVTSARGAEELQIDSDKLGLLGSSFGGFLAGGLAQRLIGKPGAVQPKLIILDGAMLSDPTVAFGGESPQIAKYYHVWTTENDRDVAVHLDSGEATKNSLSPLNTLRSMTKSDVSRLPEHFINIAEFDSLASGEYEYGRLLLDAGVATDVRVWRGTVHVFPTLVPKAQVSQRAMLDWVAAFKEACIDVQEQGQAHL